MPEEKSWNEIESIMGKINKYEEVKSGEKDVAGYMDTMLIGLPPEVNLTSLSYKENKVSIEFEAASVLSFTKIVSNYLENPSVEKIDLKSATLETSGNIFTIESEVTFR
jgi:AAA15 family ATPase/GTPase